MALEDEDFFDLIAESLVFASNKGHTSLRGYLESTPTWPLGLRTPVYFFSSSGAARQLRPMAEARGWTVLDAEDPLDREVVVTYGERNPDRVRLVPLDECADWPLFEDLEGEERSRFLRVEADAERHLRRSGLGRVIVYVRRFPPASLPAVVIATRRAEAERRLAELSNEPWLLESLAELAAEASRVRRPRPLTLVLNAGHPLVSSLGEGGAGAAGETARGIVIGLFHAALLRSPRLLSGLEADVLYRELVEHLEGMLGGDRA
jgi:hypothetical protein